MAQRKVLVIDAGHQAFDELTDDDLATPPSGGAVDSVNGETGVVVLDAADVGADAAGAAATAASGAASALGNHEADTTSIHGIADTAALYRAGGTDVAVGDGGTGASTAADARANLGLGTAAVAATGDFDAAGAASGAVSAHDAAGDPHPGYLLTAEGNAAYDPLGAAAAAQAASQPLDSDLTAFAGLAIAADKLPYGTGSHALGLADLTAAGRALIDDADTAAQRATLGLGSLATASSLAHSATTGQGTDDHHAQLHAAAHASGAGDAVKLDDLAAPDDNTDLNVSTAKHGLTPKLPNDATKYLDGSGAYSVPPGSGSGAPTTADYLVGTAQAGLSAEIVVGATPQGELGGTWASPTVDDVHSGTSHFDAVAAAGLLPAGAIAQTFSRLIPAANIALLSTGRMSLVMIYLPAGKTITTITFASGTTALSVGVNQWFALFNAATRAKLAVTVDDTSTAWAAGAEKPLALSSPFVTTYTGYYYIGIMVKATTVPSLIQPAFNATIGVTVLPIIGGNSTSGLTNPASCPDPAGAIGGGVGFPYAYVS